MASGVTEPRSAGPAASGAVAYLLAARALRDFGDGFVAILLPVYLLALGFSPLEIGVIATAALLGSALLTLGIGLIGSRHDRQRLLLAGASLMIATGVAYRRRPRLCPAAGRRICRHDQSLGGQRQRVRAAGACGAQRRRVRPQPHPDVRPLQPGRCPERRLRRARCGGAGISRRRGGRPADGHQGDVRALRPARRRRLPSLLQNPQAASTGERGTGGCPRAVTAHRLQARRPVQPRRLRRRLRRPVVAGAVALRALRSVAERRQPVLLLVGGAFRLLLPGRGVDFHAASVSSTPWCSRTFRRASA